MGECRALLGALGLCGLWIGCRLRTTRGQFSRRSYVGGGDCTRVSKLVLPDPLGPISKKVGSSFATAFR